MMMMPLSLLYSKRFIPSAVRNNINNKHFVVAYLSSKAPAAAPPAPPPKPAAPAPAAAAAAPSTEISPLTEKRTEMSQIDKHLVYYNKDAESKYLPAPTLPDNIYELTALDPSDRMASLNMKSDGTQRIVHIRQAQKSSKQAPLNPESIWRIYFYEDGTNAERWINPLMGWTSNADPYQTNPPITFETASDAVHFAQKCGWKYYVHMPIKRMMRNDNAQYQDNFLKPSIVVQLQKDGIGIKEWQRNAACTSHYFRPYNYHGTKPTPQYGPNGTAPIAPHVTGIYKRR